MKITKSYLIILTIFLAALSCSKESPTPEFPHKTISLFSELLEFQYLYQKSNVENGTVIETYEIKYRSDGLMITGYISKPADNKIYPALIYCRGGNRDFGTIDRNSLEKQRDLSGAGFIVLSSQLRGNTFSQGQDETGGADLNDILQLIKIAKSLDFVKEDLVSIHGVSRGGRNAYQISRISDEIKSVSVVGAPVDLSANYKDRPEMYTRVYLPLIGDTIKYKQRYDDRSPIKWVDELNEPILILHGKADWRGKIEHVQRIIPELEKHNKEFEYHFIEDGTHGLGSHRLLRDSLIVEWHRRHLK